MVELLVDAGGQPAPGALGVEGLGTREKTRAYAVSKLKDGKFPTIRDARKAIGGGSHDTIGLELEALALELGNPKQIPNIPQPLADLFIGLYEAAALEAGKRFDAEREGLKQEAQTAAAEREAVSAEKALLEEKVSLLIGEHEELARQRDELHQHNEEIKRQLAQKKAELEDTIKNGRADLLRANRENDALRIAIDDEKIKARDREIELVSLHRQTEEHLAFMLDSARQQVIKAEQDGASRLAAEKTTWETKINRLDQDVARLRTDLSARDLALSKARDDVHMAQLREKEASTSVLHLQQQVSLLERVMQQNKDALKKKSGN